MMRYKLLAAAVIAAILAYAGIRVAERMRTPSLQAAELASAVTRAQSSLPRFRQRLEKPLPTDHAFFLRGKFSDSEDRTEFLWLNHVEPSGDVYQAVVAEKPFILTNVHQGDKVTVAPANIVDWTIVHDDRTREGDFTQGLEPNAR